MRKYFAVFMVLCLTSAVDIAKDTSVGPSDQKSSKGLDVTLDLHKNGAVHLREVLR